MRDDKDHGHHHPGKRAGRLPLWLLTLGAFGLLGLIAGGIVAVAFVGEQFLAKPPGDESAPLPAGATPADQGRRDGPALPIGR